MRALSTQEMKEIEPEMVTDYRKGVTVRFMFEGKSIRITDGRAMSEKGDLVINQYFYFQFTRKTALKIARLTGTKAVFDRR